MKISIEGCFIYPRCIELEDNKVIAIAKAKTPSLNASILFLLFALG